MECDTVRSGKISPILGETHCLQLMQHVATTRPYIFTTPHDFTPHKTIFYIPSPTERILRYVTFRCTHDKDGYFYVEDITLFYRIFNDTNK